MPEKETSNPESRLKIEKICYDSTSENFPRIWTIAGTLKRDLVTEGQEETGSTEIINVRLFYGPDKDWKDKPKDKFESNAWSKLVQVLCLKEHTTYEDVVAGHDQDLWVAHLDVSEHPEIQPFLDWVVKATPEYLPDILPEIGAIAWLEVPEGSDQQTTIKSFKIYELSPRAPWDVGILLVHGINEHDDNDLLASFAEPVVRFLEDWTNSFNKWSARRFNQATVKKFFDDGWSTVNSWRQDQLDVERAINLFQKHASENGGWTEMSDAPEGPILVHLRVLDVQVSGEFTGSALVRLSAVDKRGARTQSEWLFKEAIWAKHVLLPEQGELMDWIRDSLPVSVINYIDRRLKRSIWKPRFMGWISNLVFRLMAPVYFLLSATGILILRALALVQLIPFGPLQRLIGRIFRLLMLTIGHSYAFNNSSMRRRAITSRVSESLNWLCGHSQKVAIISHSQGVAVTNDVLRSQKWDQVKNWNMLGSGLQPLLQLRKHSDNKLAGKANFMMLSALLFAVAGLLFTPPSRWAYLVLGLYFLSWSMLSALKNLLENVEQHDHETHRTTVLNNSKEYYATRDPVPNGELFSKHNIVELNASLKKQPRFKEDNPDREDIVDHENREVFNEHSFFADHGGYFKNVEEVVSRMAFDITDLARSNSDLPDLRELHNQDRANLDHARNLRRKLVPLVSLYTGWCWLILLATMGMALAPLWTPTTDTVATCLALIDGDCGGQFGSLTARLNMDLLVPFLALAVALIGLKLLLKNRVSAIGKWLTGPKEAAAPRLWRWIETLWATIGVLTLILFVTEFFTGQVGILTSRFWP